eukprot:364700-Chlamydomonas_euryale.AAC.10
MRSRERPKLITESRTACSGPIESSVRNGASSSTLSGTCAWTGGRAVGHAAAGWQIDTEVAEGYGRPPDLEEVHACFKDLRSHAAPGDNQIEATFLKAGLPIAQWLLKVICFVWESSIAPAEWKSGVIASLYKGKGPRDAAGSHHGISLPCIVDKVHAALLLHSRVEQIELKLEADKGFRKGRGITGAMYILSSSMNAVTRHQLPTAPDDVTPTLAIAFVDLIKAYDSISREAPWEVPWEVVWSALVRDQTARRSDHGHGGGRTSGGEAGHPFTVEVGVQQEFKIAPTLFSASRSTSSGPSVCTHGQPQAKTSSASARRPSPSH